MKTFRNLQNFYRKLESLLILMKFTVKLYIYSWIYKKNGTNGPILCYLSVAKVMQCKSPQYSIRQNSYEIFEVWFDFKGENMLLCRSCSE